MTRIHAHGFLRDAVLAGDDTKQFTAGKHPWAGSRHNG